MHQWLYSTLDIKNVQVYNNFYFIFLIDEHNVYLNARQFEAQVLHALVPSG